MFVVRELELPSMFGPFERQGFHIPEPACIVMAAAAGAQSSPDRPAAARFVPEDTP